VIKYMGSKKPTNPNLKDKTLTRTGRGKEILDPTLAENDKCELDRFQSYPA
jgi:hypothetical protein